MFWRFKRIQVRMKSISSGLFWSKDGGGHEQAQPAENHHLSSFNGTSLTMLNMHVLACSCVPVWQMQEHSWWGDTLILASFEKKKACATHLWWCPDSGSVRSWLPLCCSYLCQRTTAEVQTRDSLTERAVVSKLAITDTTSWFTLQNKVRYPVVTPI